MTESTKSAWLLLCCVCLFSCQTYHPLEKYNYFNGNTLYNQPLNISIDYFGDVDIIPLVDLEKRKIRKTIGKIYGLGSRDLLFSGRTNLTPEYKLYFFIQKADRKDKPSTEPELVLKDQSDLRVLYRKSNGAKSAYLLLEAVNSNKSIQSILKDGQSILNSLKFEIGDQNRLTYSKVFESNRNNRNYLEARNILRDAPIPKTEGNQWMQFQYLATINSLMGNNPEYNAMIEQYESSRKRRLQPMLFITIEKCTRLSLQKYTISL